MQSGSVSEGAEYLHMPRRHYVRLSDAASLAIGDPDSAVDRERPAPLPIHRSYFPNRRADRVLRARSSSLDSILDC